MTIQTAADLRVRQTIRECWSTLFEVPQHAVTDSSNFFADGGDSFLAVELVTAVGDALDFDVAVDWLFLDGTFGTFAETTAEAVAAG